MCFRSQLSARLFRAAQRTARKTLSPLVVLASACFAIPAFAFDTSFNAPGASKDLAESLSAASAVMSADTTGLETPYELLAAARSDYATMVQILYDRGYFGPVVNIRVDGQEAALIKPLETPSKISRVDITVQIGKRFTFGKAAIAPMAEGTELPETFASGQTATTGAMRDAANAGIDGWKDVGHPKADLAGQKITAKHPQARIDAELALNPGPKLRFGKLHTSDTTKVREQSLQDIAGFPTGDVYSPEGVQTVGTRLRRTGTFSSVSITERETPNPDGTLDFDAKFEDMPPRRFSFGGEVSSSSGVDVSVLWMHRNVFNRASRFTFEAAIRNIGGDEDLDGRVGVRLDQPDALGPDDNMLYFAEIERLNRTHFMSTRAMAGFGARRTFSDELYAEQSIALNFSRADDAFGENRKFRYIYLPFRTEWDKRDNAVNAQNGYYLDSHVMPFLGLADSKSGLRIELDGRAYMSLGERIVLAGRLQIGSMVGAQQDEVTPELLFFSGGAGSVRGQPYESLGVAVPPNGDIAGGRGYAAASLELRGQVTEKFSLVGFFDIGAVDADSLVSSSSVTHSGAGLGVRYDLGGFGPLRLDLAYPVDGDTSEGLQFYLGIGQAF